MRETSLSNLALVLGVCAGMTNSCSAPRDPHVGLMAPIHGADLNQSYRAEPASHPLLPPAIKLSCKSIMLSLKSGDPVTIEAIYVNLTNHQIASNHGLSYPNAFRFRVTRDHSVELKPLQPNIHLIGGDERMRAVAGSIADLIIPVGGTHRITIPIDTFFDMREPGHYVVTLLMSDNRYPIEPESCTVRVDIFR